MTENEITGDILDASTICTNDPCLISRAHGGVPRIKAMESVNSQLIFATIYVIIPSEMSKTGGIHDRPQGFRLFERVEEPRYT